MIRHSLAALACLVPLSVLAAPQTYVLDPLHSYPHFKVTHMGVSYLLGRFERMTGKIVLDQAARSGSLEVKIPTVTVTTGDEKRAAPGVRSRDEHLRSVDFFNSAEFPDMIYKSTKFNFDGDRLESIEGHLTLLGVTKPVRLTVPSFKCGTNPMNRKPMCGADVEGTLKRSEFGMNHSMGTVSDEVRLMIAVEAYPE